MSKRVEYPKGVEELKIIKVIVTKSIVGDGTEKNPVRILHQYWDFKGRLLTYKDYLNFDESQE